MTIDHSCLASSVQQGAAATKTANCSEPVIKYKLSNAKFQGVHIRPAALVTPMCSVEMGFGPAAKKTVAVVFDGNPLADFATSRTLVAQTIFQALGDFAASMQDWGTKSHARGA